MGGDNFAPGALRVKLAVSGSGQPGHGPAAIPELAQPIEYSRCRGRRGEIAQDLRLGLVDINKRRDPAGLTAEAGLLNGHTEMLIPC